MNADASIEHQFFYTIGMYKTLGFVSFAIKLGDKPSFSNIGNYICMLSNFFKRIMISLNRLIIEFASLKPLFCFFQ
jgi:hypothetical protein